MPTQTWTDNTSAKSLVTLNGDEEIRVVDDPAGTPVAGKTTVDALKAYIESGIGEILTGSGVPSSGLGKNGDAYIRTSNGDLYEKAGGSWSVVGSLAGPAGANGADGAPGADGATGPAGADGSGNVNAPASFGTDNRLLRSDGTGTDVQVSPITADDSGNVSGVAALSATTIDLGHASDTTIARSDPGDITIEGKAVYRADGTDVSVADGGTGASTAIAGFRALAEGLSSTQGQMAYRGAAEWEAMAAGSAGDLVVSGGASGNPSFKTRHITPATVPKLTGTDVRYMGPVGSGTVASNTGSVGRLYFIPMHFGEDKTLTEIGIHVTTLAASGVGRLGLYEFQNGLPGDFIADFGEFATTSTGYKGTAINQAVVASKWYFVALAFGVALPNIGFIANAINSLGGLTTGTIGGQYSAAAMHYTWTYGPLPTTNRSGETFTRVFQSPIILWNY